MNILITGGCGFIGFHLSLNLSKTHKIFIIDNLSKDINFKIKRKRFEILQSTENISIHNCDICDLDKIDTIFSNTKFDKVIHLAAKTGVRESSKIPFEYVKSNIYGFVNILESCKKHSIKNFYFASSSSVYGNCKDFPLKEDSKNLEPISLYGTTKKTNEELAKLYSKKYSINCIGFRFFTVYGEYGREDMAYSIFANGIKNNKKINVYNNGEMYRDFTYISDCINGIIPALELNKNYTILNIGSGTNYLVKDLITELEKNLDKKATINNQTAPEVDVKKTLADITKAKELIDYNPKITLKEGIKRYCDWFKSNI